MSQTLAIVVPVFALILLGYLVGRTRLMPAEGTKAMVNFCYFIALPAILFRTMAALEAPKSLDPTILAAYFAPAVLHFLGAMAVGRFVFGQRLADRALFAMAATYGNILLLGIPLVLTAFGERATVPQMLIMALHPVVLITLCSLFVEIDRGRSAGGAGGARGAGAVALAALVGLAANPIIVAMAAGLGAGLAGIVLPPVVDKILVLLGQGAAPVALFALGASLAGFKLAADLLQVAALTALKIAVLPAMVFVSAEYVFGLAPLWVAVATLSAAMPAGVNAFVFAERYAVGQARAAATVLVSTALAWIGAAALLAWFLPRVGG
jgi:malonate transporter and related proteins